jgi:membrane-bound lytic murein transglycosylase D
MNVDTARVLSPLRAATGIVVLTALFALGGCGLITRPAPPPAASSAADNEPEPPPPEADTATAQPPEDWQALDQDTGPQPPPVVTQAPAAPPPPPEDLWQRLRTHFSLPDVDNARVERELHWYATHEAYMQRVADRARPYLYYIVEQLAARNMPVDFALLPIVESAYDPFAYSRGRAAGLWQFIPSTGKRFDLRQNWWYDGRRDVAASTRAALDYLQYLHNKFDGNWLLALAAYNSGSGAVRYAIRKNERRGKPTDFWHLDLPRETRAYVPRLLAVRDLVADAAKYGVDLPEIPNKPYLARVPIDTQVDIAHAAKMAGLTLKQMYLLNPGFNRWATEPGKTEALFVPLAKADQFAQALATWPVDERVQWLHHKIHSGETLSSIANHYGTTIKILKQVNHLDGSMIRAGHYLMVPNAATSLDQYALNEIMHLRHVELARKGNKIIHIVRPGDSLWRIGHRYGVTVAELAQWNHIAASTTLSIGQKLVIWRHGKHVAGLRTVSATPADMLRKIHYTVRSGDSLWSISNHFNVDVHKLAGWNSLSLDDYLQPGQHLLLYIDVRSQSTQS